MRNLDQHPITIEEILDCLDRLITEISAEEKVGDMRPSLLHEAKICVIAIRDRIEAK